MRDIKELLQNCNDVKLKEWAANKSWQEIYKGCHRGDWLLLLFQKANSEDVHLLTLVKGYSANTVRHLLEDTKSIAAVDAAISFGQCTITEKQLADACADAHVALDAAEFRSNSSIAWTLAKAAAINADTNHPTDDLLFDIASAITSLAASKAAFVACAACADINVADLTAAITLHTAAHAYATDDIDATSFVADTILNKIVPTSASIGSLATTYTELAIKAAAWNKANVDNFYRKELAARVAVLRNSSPNISPNVYYKTALNSNQLLTANIVRDIIPIDSWNISN